MKFTAPITNLHAHFSSLSENSPQRIALKAIDRDGITKKTVTYRELEREIVRAAAWLFSLGLKKGDVVALALSNSPELLIISWAAWASGIITAPLDTKKDTLAEHIFKVRLSGAKIVIASDDLFTQKDKRMLAVSLTFIEEFDAFEEKENFSFWAEDLSHLSLILFTSGTTSKPKGAKLTLQNLIANADGIRDWFYIQKNDAFIVNLPLHHINSTTFCLATLLSGATIIIPSVYSNSRFFLQAARSSATFTSVVQSIIFDQLSREKEYKVVKKDLKLSRIQIGSAPVVVSDAKEFIRKFAIPLYQGYGQTETALRVTGVPLDLPQKLYQEFVESNCIGAPMKWAEVEIMDSDGKILGEGREGEIVVRGPIVMQGYIGDIEAFKNGYFLTGDIGYYKKIGDKRYFFLKGRMKEIIIKGGINISPVAVEDKLKKLSDDVAQAYAIGVPDVRYGEEIGIAVVWKKDTPAAREKLKRILREKNEQFSAYDTPQYIATIRTDELPLTSTGKVQRSVLAKRLALEEFESIYEIARTSKSRFLLLHEHSVFFDEVFTLFNKAWEPLIVSREEFIRQQKQLTTVVSVGKRGGLLGMISFLRTNASIEEIATHTYKDIVKGDISDPEGKKIICMSIVSASHNPGKALVYAKHPAREAVEKYVLEGHDDVFEFHRKAKGGFEKGARLVKAIENGRAEDVRSCGYTMLLQYPKLTGAVRIDPTRSVATQLIEAVMQYAKEANITEVLAYSRPAGLAHFLSSST